MLTNYDSVRTVVTTSIITAITTIDSTTTLSATGTISACPVYVPSQPPFSEVDPPTSTTAPLPESTVSPEPSPVAAPLPPGCINTQEYQYPDADGTVRAYKSCMGYAYTAGGADNIYPYNWSPSVLTYTIESCALLCRQALSCFGFNYLPGNPTTCNLLVTAPNTLQTGTGPNYPWSYYHFTGQVSVPMAAKRQASGTVPKPVCLRATNAAQTSSACRCAIPTPATTITSTAVVQSTSTRTIVRTVKVS